MTTQVKQLIDQVLRGKDSRDVVNDYRESVRRGELDESAATMYHYYDRQHNKSRNAK